MSFLRGDCYSNRLFFGFFTMLDHVCVYGAHILSHICLPYVWFIVPNLMWLNICMECESKCVTCMFCGWIGSSIQRWMLCQIVHSLVKGYVTQVCESFLKNQCFQLRGSLWFTLLPHDSTTQVKLIRYGLDMDYV